MSTRRGTAGQAHSVLRGVVSMRTPLRHMHVERDVSACFFQSGSAIVNGRRAFQRKTMRKGLGEDKLYVN